jgi:universal stress protein A
MATKKILYATDYSQASKAALPIATCLAREAGATLLIAHVSEHEQYPVGELFDEEPEPDEEELRALKAVVPDDPRVKYEHRLLYGPPGSAETVKPADALLRLAEKERPAGIVIGTHGRSGLAHMLMGSVAESVTRRADCPVVIIRPAIRK